MSDTPATVMRDRARRALPRFAFDYMEGGSDEEQCLRRNTTALDRLLLIPQRLIDVAEIQCQAKLFNSQASLPIAIAPTGFNSLLWPDGDVALARAAATFRIPFTVSTAANRSIEEICRVPELNCWFQLYVFQGRGIAEALMARAQAAGCHVLLLTVDMPMSGYRARDVKNKFHRHFSYRRMALDLLKRPRWTYRMLRAGKPKLANITADGASPSSLSQAREVLANGAMDRSLTWHNIEWVRRHWSGPLVLKGILNPADAERARSLGIEGIVLSNHGGRQLDCAPAAVDMLYETASRVRKHLTVLVDGGFTRGSDVVKALALGAHGVLIGRAALYGLATAGEKGVYAVLAQLKEDVERTLALLGVARIRDLGPQHVAVERSVSALESPVDATARWSGIA